MAQMLKRGQGRGIQHRLIARRQVEAMRVTSGRRAIAAFVQLL
jgi:hypothetical protein